MSDLPEIERLQAVELRDGDAIVLTVPSRTSTAVAGRVAEAVRDKLGVQQVVVLTSGMDLSVVRPEVAEQLRELLAEADVT